MTIVSGARARRYARIRWVWTSLFHTPARRAHSPTNSRQRCGSTGGFHLAGFHRPPAWRNCGRRRQKRHARGAGSYSWSTPATSPTRTGIGPMRWKLRGSSRSPFRRAAWLPARGVIASSGCGVLGHGVPRGIQGMRADKSGARCRRCRRVIRNPLEACVVRPGIKGPMLSEAQLPQG
jgi:hypothetical protein